VKLALEPEREAVFEPRSYGFRPGRSVQDAAAAVKHGLGGEGAGRPNQQARCHWILDADIKSFFDEIDHDVILARTPVFRRVIAGWLQAGAFTGEVFTPTEMGTPQGGVISPLLANIALHGMEDLFHEWSLVGGKRFVCEILETFTAPPQGYRRCRPENALNSLRGPTKPRRSSRRMPPKVYGPYPDGTWRTLRLVVNDKRTRTNPALRRDRKLRDLRVIRYADDFVVLARSRRQLETVVLPSCESFSQLVVFSSALRKQELSVRRKDLTSSVVSSSDFHRPSSWCARVVLRFGNTSMHCQRSFATALSRSVSKFRRPTQSFVASVIIIAPTTARPCSGG
jgi:retron-type reverse transcriptase